MPRLEAVKNGNGTLNAGLASGKVIRCHLRISRQIDEFAQKAHRFISCSSAALRTIDHFYWQAILPLSSNRLLLNMEECFFSMGIIKKIIVCQQTVFASPLRIVCSVIMIDRSRCVDTASPMNHRKLIMHGPYVTLKIAHLKSCGSQ